MPSISQAKLDEMAAAREDTARQAAKAEAQAREAEARVRAFDGILDKVVRAAEGRPLIEDRNMGYGGGYMGSMIEANGQRKLKTVERQEQEIRSLNERVVALEARLAATVAVATFARAHKA